jgi:hypothetical protein
MVIVGSAQCRAPGLGNDAVFSRVDTQRNMAQQPGLGTVATPSIMVYGSAHCSQVQPQLALQVAQQAQQLQHQQYPGQRMKSLPQHSLHPWRLYACWALCLLHSSRSHQKQHPQLHQQQMQLQQGSQRLCRQMPLHLLLLLLLLQHLLQLPALRQRQGQLQGVLQRRLRHLLLQRLSHQLPLVFWVSRRLWHWSCGVSDLDMWSLFFACVVAAL